MVIAMLSPRRDDRLDRVGEVVEVEHANALDLGEPVEVVVLGHERRAARTGQLDEAGVHLGRTGEVEIDDLADDVLALLEGIDDAEPAAALLAAEGIGGVRDALELLEHESGDEQAPGDEPGRCDVDDPAVDEHARVDDHRLAVERRQGLLVDVDIVAARAPAEDDGERIPAAAAGPHAHVDERGGERSARSSRRGPRAAD